MSHFFSILALCVCVCVHERLCLCLRACRFDCVCVVWELGTGFWLGVWLEKRSHKRAEEKTQCMRGMIEFWSHSNPQTDSTHYPEHTSTKSPDSHWERHVIGVFPQTYRVVLTGIGAEFVELKDLNISRVKLSVQKRNRTLAEHSALTNCSPLPMLL